MVVQSLWKRLKNKVEEIILCGKKECDVRGIEKRDESGFIVESASEQVELAWQKIELDSDATFEYESDSDTDDLTKMSGVQVF